MIRIELRKAGSGYACRAAGHAGYGPAGSDIVCAAVSALLWTLLMGWERLEKEKRGAIAARVMNPGQADLRFYAGTGRTGGRGICSMLWRMGLCLFIRNTPGASSLCPKTSRKERQYDKPIHAIRGRGSPRGGYGSRRGCGGGYPGQRAKKRPGRGRKRRRAAGDAPTPRWGGRGEENAAWQQAQRQAEKVRQTVANWLREQENVQRDYPGFSLEEALKDPDFARLVRAGVSMRRAYEAVHCPKFCMTPCAGQRGKAKAAPPR